MPTTRPPSPYALRVLDVVRQVPRGRVLTYGDVRDWLEESSPRAVGAVLRIYGDEVPWWRVVFADGRLPPGEDGRAESLLRAEGTLLRPDGRVDLAACRWTGDDPARRS